MGSAMATVYVYVVWSVCGIVLTVQGIDENKNTEWDMDE